MSLLDRLSAMQRAIDLAADVVAHRIAAPQPARHAPLPAGLHEEVHRAMAALGMRDLYVHQAQAVAGALAGEDHTLVEFAG